MGRKEIVSVLFASILILSVFSFISAGVFSNTFHKTQITGEVIDPVCSDSDNEKDYFTKGTIVGGGVSFVQYDYCLTLTSTGQIDSVSCEASNPDCRLHEFYCENEIRKSVIVSCEYGCSDGVCNSEPFGATSQEPICTDTDNGLNQYLSGKAYDPNNVSRYIEDICQNENYLMEAYCKSGGLILAEQKYCKYGCKEGRCLYANESNKTFSNCRESDGGAEFYIKGELKTSFSNVSSVDNCEGDNKTLVEYYCSPTPTTETPVMVKNYICPEGCSNGACIKIQDMNKTQDKNQTQEQNQTMDKNQTQEQNLNQGQSNKNLSSVDTGVNCEFGCFIEGKCYAFGYRKMGKYCYENNTFIPQLTNEVYCENNFECRSNLCIDDECVNQGAFTRMMNWFKNSLGKKK